MALDTVLGDEQVVCLLDLRMRHEKAGSDLKDACELLMVPSLSIDRPRLH